MLTALRRFIRDESGEDLIEYGLLAAFAASVAFAVLILDPLNLQEGVKNAYKRAKSALSNA
jgi:Flp pilus assembly pilin Flp